MSGIQYENLSSDQIEEFKEAFKLFDMDGDGGITAKELLTTMRMLGQNPTEAEIEEVMSVVDMDGSRSIDQPEFFRLMAMPLVERDTEEEFIQAFEVFDKNKTGKLGKEELGIILGNLGEKLTEEEVDEILREADTDGDGAINYAEFVEMMTGPMRMPKKLVEAPDVTSSFPKGK